jgi:hypothetical protein
MEKVLDDDVDNRDSALLRDKELSTAIKSFHSHSFIVCGG